MPEEKSENSNALRSSYFIAGCLCLLALLILAIVFFKERITFADTALQQVYLLIEQRPCINFVRPGAIIPQIIPLIAIWLHGSLRTVMVLHSVSFIVFFISVYLVAYRYSRSHLIFFLIPIYLLLITNEVFYWPQSELQQGMVWLCLYAVFLYEDNWSNVRSGKLWLIHFFCILWIQFFHPLIFFPLLFLIIYYYQAQSASFSKKGMMHTFLCFASFGMRYLVGMADAYEKDRLNMGSRFIHNLPHLLSLDTVHSFIAKLPDQYAVYALALIAGIGWLAANGRYHKALWLCVCSVGYWLLIMTSEPEGRFYTENMLLPLGFMAALPWVADILPGYRTTSIVIVVTLVLLSRLIFIYSAHRDYTDRIAAYQPYFDYISDKKLKGIFVDQRSADSKKLISTWASGYESMLISSFHSADSCKVVQIDRMAEADSSGYYSNQLHNDTAIITRYRIWGQSRIPKRYFKLREGGYEMYQSRE